jgi:hypothetical protein
MRHNPGLAASPPARYMLQVERSRYSPFPRLPGEVARFVQPRQLSRVSDQVDPGDPSVLHHQAHRGRLASGLDPVRGRAVEPHGRGRERGPACTSTLPTSSPPQTGPSVAAASPPPSAIRTTSGAMTSIRGHRFLADYQAAARRFGPGELDVATAAGTWLRCYNARCQLDISQRVSEPMRMVRARLEGGVSARQRPCRGSRRTGQARRRRASAIPPTSAARMR